MTKHQNKASPPAPPPPPKKKKKKNVKKNLCDLYIFLRASLFACFSFLGKAVAHGVSSQRPQLPEQPLVLRFVLLHRCLPGSRGDGIPGLGAPDLVAQRLHVLLAQAARKAGLFILFVILIFWGGCVLCWGTNFRWLKGESKENNSRRCFLGTNLLVLKGKPRENNSRLGGSLGFVGYRLVGFEGKPWVCWCADLVVSREAKGEQLMLRWDRWSPILGLIQIGELGCPLCGKKRGDHLLKDQKATGTTGQSSKQLNSGGFALRVLQLEALGFQLLSPALLVQHLLGL